MRKSLMSAAVVSLGLCLSLAGCAHNSGSSQGGEHAIKTNEIPAAVTAAFTAEHPYAQIHDPLEDSDQNGPTQYVLPYIRPDGTQGTATYAPTGELLSDH